MINIKYLRKASLIAASTLILSSCGGDNTQTTVINPVIPGADDVEKSKIVFDPSAGVLALPNDLLFSGTTDGTLEPPDEADAKDAGEAVDFSNPGAAIGAMDGWSTQMPMQISVSTPGSATIDASTVGPSSVMLIETDCQLGGTGCTTFTPVDYGPTGYVAVAGARSITVVPAVPLKPKTNYIVALTNDIMDSRGEPVEPSSLYVEVTRDPAEVDIQNESLGALQDAINGYESIAAAAAGVSPDSFIYTASWTTASVGDSLGAALQAVTSASFSPQVTGIEPHPFVNTGAIGGMGLADIYQATVTLPYFSAVPSEENPLAPVNQSWTALCDNGVLLSQMDPAVLATLTPGPNAAACSALELADFGLDTERHITRYNPVPQMRIAAALDVIITVPNDASGFGSATWPLVIVQHGISSKKEDMLAVADSLAAAGFATIGIDLPLHGSRGFDVDVDGTDDINATTVDVTHYLNLGYLLTGRDNLRQSIADIAGLRMAIANGFNFEAGTSISDADFDRTDVHFLGLSLGGISGTGFNALATQMGMPSATATYVAAGGGILPLLLDSGSFGSLVRNSVLEGAGLDPATVDATTAANVLGQFAFAAQTIVDPVDPNNYAAGASAVSPTFVIQINDDTVIPNQSSFAGLTFGGTEPLAQRMGVSQVSFGDAPASSGLVKFTQGGHISLLSPEASAAATTEMQKAIATYVASDLIVLTDASVVE
jgi:Pla-1/cef family extracellular lipase